MFSILFLVIGRSYEKNKNEPFIKLDILSKKPDISQPWGGRVWV